MDPSQSGWIQNKKNINMEKMQELYNQYDWNFTKESIEKEVKDIVTQNYDKNNTPEIWKACLNKIDLTSLHSTDTDDQIGTMMQKVNDFKENFPNCPNVAAVCVYSGFVSTCKATLEAEGVAIAAVAGCFPHAQAPIEIKEAEVAMTSNLGADEIDVVISIGKMLSGMHSEVFDELKGMREACKNKTYKVIIESGALADPILIKQASILALAAGADFIKTSTGKMSPAATLEAAYIMCQTLVEFKKLTGETRGFKAAGGVATTQEAVEFYSVINQVLGEEWMNNRYFRFGASRLANNLLTSIEHKEVSYF